MLAVHIHLQNILKLYEPLIFKIQEIIWYQPAWIILQNFEMWMQLDVDKHIEVMLIVSMEQNFNLMGTK